MNIGLCIPVLNRYDLLHQEILSAEIGTLVPTNYFVFDNGFTFNYQDYPREVAEKIIVFKPERQVSLGSAWNYMIKNVDGERIIANDDLVFYPDTIEKLVNSEGDFICSNDIKNVNSFSLFNIRESCIEKVGYFDECFYPAYFEDNSYAYRMQLAGVHRTAVDCKVKHLGSQTIKNFTKDRMELHHIQFRKNQHRYVEMWGGMPGEETFKTPYGR